MRINRRSIEDHLVIRLITFTFITVLLLTSVQCNKDDDGDDIANTRVDMQTVTDGLVSPLGVVASPDNTKRLFIIDQIGKIWIVDSNGNRLTTPFIDISGQMVTLNPNYDE